MLKDNLFSRCCDKCWHSSEKACPDYISCLTQGPLCHHDEKCENKKKENISRITLKSMEKPMIFMGLGTCGMGAGALKTLEELENVIKEENIDVEIRKTGCIGLCTLEPLLDIKMPGRTRLSYGHVTEKNVRKILNSVINGKPEEENLIGQHFSDGDENWKNVPGFFDHPFFINQKRWVLKNCGINDPVDLEQYLANGGFLAFEKILKNELQASVCDEIEKSNLRGRGGGGFPTGKKWKFALNTPADQKYMICNADEGDPGAFMDRALIEGDPYRLLEGLMIASYAIGATQAYVYIRAEYPLAIERLIEAISNLKKFGFIGENILDSGFSLKIKIKKGAGAFVCGEETALIHSIEGKRGMPRVRPPFPATRGLFDKPTIINNVETLCNIPDIITNGYEWFCAAGTETSKGTKVFALSGNLNYTGLVEVEMGTPIREIIFQTGGGIPDNREFKAAQIGGPSGGCIPPQHLDIKVDYENLKTVGAMMGSGGLVIMDDKACMVDVAKFFMDFIQRESCGKCIPCREGTRRMLEILQMVTSNPSSDSSMNSLERLSGIITLEKLAEIIKSTSLCGLGQTAPNPVISTLRYFRSEYEEHIFNRKCSAKVCKELLTYQIDEDKCTGCTLCARVCPSEAIKGAVKSPHYIISENCVRCGSCLVACRQNAISVY
ncbi:MAG: 4Fe-4S binding protein [Deltaproteobacteria bacterium]|nr:4Fe-4S binding protein [Deltaproteobacteria bacterium]